MPSWSSSPTAATNRAGAHRPRSTARQTRLSSRPVSRNTNHALPLCAACSSNAAGRHPAIVVACVHVRARRPGQFCSRARVLAATSPFFPRKKEREIHDRAATRERKARPHSHSQRHGRPASDHRWANRPSIPPRSRTVGGGRSTRSACRSCDSGQRQVRPKNQIPVDGGRWLLSLCAF